MNPWSLYDALISPIPPDITVRDYSVGHVWTWLESDEGTMGVAMTTNVRSRPSIALDDVAGAPLREVAELAKSWNLIDASIGVAAINAWHNHSGRVDKAGLRTATGGAFDTYADLVKGKRVATIGHFPAIEERLSDAATLTILERSPRPGDFIDTAAEYVLPDQDVVFVTGSTMVNKTLPRLLELAKRATVIVTGPSTPLSPVLFDHGASGLSGLIVTDAAGLTRSLRGAGRGRPGHFGHMVDLARG